MFHSIVITRCAVDNSCGTDTTGKILHENYSYQFNGESVNNINGLTFC